MHSMQYNHFKIFFLGDFSGCYFFNELETYYSNKDCEIYPLFNPVSVILEVGLYRNGEQNKGYINTKYLILNKNKCVVRFCYLPLHFKIIFPLIKAPKKQKLQSSGKQCSGWNNLPR